MKGGTKKNLEHQALATTPLLLALAQERRSRSVLEHLPNAFSRLSRAFQVSCRSNLLRDAHSLNNTHSQLEPVCHHHTDEVRRKRTKLTSSGETGR